MAEKKRLEALRISERPKIDGILDEECWQTAEMAKDWIQHEPFNGKAPSEPTEVMVCYDDNSLYVGAIMYDSNPDGIMRELSQRDPHDLNADLLTILLSPYNDGNNAYTFGIFASGVQLDVKYFSSGEDPSWDAVWKSQVSITEAGWVAEIEIPYSAIRFPKQADQTWGINFAREIRRSRESSSWNFLDKKVEGVTNQSGLLTNIHDIKPPLRLSFEPFIVTNLSKDPGSTTWSPYFNGGIDLKYGINESFTLDMTLIPDFSQVQSDDIIVNLSPFETYYSEKRQFFTEGVELFSKGDIFYSRRVGAEPLGYERVNEDYAEEDIIENPKESWLLNATKVSGRTSKGTGLGLFNGITAPSYATVKDSTGAEMDVLTQPFTNYNMLVVDQSLPNKSYISFYNTNVYRGRNEYSANVSGAQMDIRNRKNQVSLGGLLNVSQKYYPEASPDFGFIYELSLAKISGTTHYGLYQKMESDTYDPNDMGFNESNNEFENGAFFSYNVYEPFWKILQTNNEISLEYKQLYAPREFTGFEIDFEHRTLFKNNLTVGINSELSPVESRDYFEPRHEGWFVRLPASYSVGAFYSPDYNKTFLVDIASGVSWASSYNQWGYYFRAGPRFKTNYKLFMVLSALYSRNFNNLGYATDSTVNEDLYIIFGARDLENITTTFTVNYTVNAKINFNVRLRYYYFKVIYNQYYDLQKDGHLTQTGYMGADDFIFNAFNIDAYFTWLFAPGSELVLAWKNSIHRNGELPSGGYFNEFGNTLKAPAGNLVSLKILYYLDSQYFKKLKKKTRDEG